MKKIKPINAVTNWQPIQVVSVLVEDPEKNNAIVSVCSGSDPLHPERLVIYWIQVHWADGRQKLLSLFRSGDTDGDVGLQDEIGYRIYVSPYFGDMPPDREYANYLSGCAVNIVKEYFANRGFERKFSC